MTITALIPAEEMGLRLPAATSFDAWLDTGRALFASRRNLDWMTADWIATGLDRFPDQIEMAFLSSDLGIDGKFLIAAAKTAKAFPQSVRDSSLTIQHHEHVADLPPTERLSMLKQAGTEHWTAKQIRIEAMRLKVEIGQITMLTDDDHDQQRMMDLTRAWNRAPHHIQDDFLPMAEQSIGDGSRVIDA